MAKPQEEMTTLMLRKSDRERLTALALELGYRWGERGNATRLIEAVARAEVPLSRTQSSWTADRIEALLQAYRALVETGQTAHAQVMRELLLERPELGPLERAQLEAAAALDTAETVARLRSFIESRQPFCLSYQDAAENWFEFTILYADIVFRERRQYLECWVEGATGGLDVEALASNRTLRIDRIPNPAIVPLPDKQWRSAGLDTIEVELHLFDRLMHTYEPKMGDFRDEWGVIAGQNVRRVWRRISNSFWFAREVFVYGPECVVVSPDMLRQRIASQVEKTWTRYRSMSETTG
jgi:predicted DNA-binding transcriptional regulator YafY